MIVQLGVARFYVLIVAVTGLVLIGLAYPITVGFAWGYMAGAITNRHLERWLNEQKRTKEQLL